MGSVLPYPKPAGIRPPFGGDPPGITFAPEPNDDDLSTLQNILNRVALAMAVRSHITRADADNLLSLLDAREAQIQRELHWARLINPSSISSERGELAPFEQLLEPADEAEAKLTWFLDQIWRAKTLLLSRLDATD